MSHAMTVYRPQQVEVLEPETEPRATAAMFAFGEIVARQTADAVMERLAPPRLTDAEEVVAWAKAYDDWLHFVPKTGDPRPAATVHAYDAAWTSLRNTCRKEARFITGLDIARWVEMLRTRTIDPTVHGGLVKNGRRVADQVGLSPKTVNMYIAGISSFYSYCQNKTVATSDGRERPLLDGPNPAKSHEVKRPKTKRFGADVMWLDEPQLKALRTAIRSAQTLGDLERGVASNEQTLRELRDYALILSYMMTGARNAEIRIWQWKNLTRHGSTVFYSWANKGKDGDDELPGPCWDAVQDYLRLAGRLETIQPNDYIFQPMTDSVLHFHRFDGVALVDPATWSRNRPISAQEANRLLRKYCRRAGIDTFGVHIHTLRHSCESQLAEMGVPIEDRSKQLHHSSLDMTMGYHHQKAGQRNANWQKMADRLGI